MPDFVRICWGGRIRTSDWLIQSHVIVLAFQCASFFENSWFERRAGPKSLRESDRHFRHFGAPASANDARGLLSADPCNVVLIDGSDAAGSSRERRSAPQDDVDPG